MTIQERLKQFRNPSALLCVAMLVGGCAVNGDPLGAFRHTITNAETCTVTVENSVNILLLGVSTTSNKFDEDCARGQLVRLLISADMSHDEQADADMKALGIAIAGLKDDQVEDAIKNVTEGLDHAPIARQIVADTVRRYRESLKAMGADQAKREMRPQLMALRRQVAEANQLYITIEKPDFCPVDHYNDIVNDMKLAYPSATVTLRDSTLANMGISIPAETPNAESIKQDLCHGSFMYVSARQGVGANEMRVRDEAFYADQTNAVAENRPTLNPVIPVGHVAQVFATSDDYQAEILRREAEQARLRAEAHERAVKQVAMAVAEGVEQARQDTLVQSFERSLRMAEQRRLAQAAEAVEEAVVTAATPAVQIVEAETVKAEVDGATAEKPGRLTSLCNRDASMVGMVSAMLNVDRNAPQNTPGRPEDVLRGRAANRPKHADKGISRHPKKPGMTLGTAQLGASFVQPISLKVA